MTTKHLVLDTDVGIDDAMMILSVALDPAAEIVAIGSSHGNCSAAVAAGNAIRVLDVLRLTHVPVAVGLESPLANPITALHVHGQDGLGDANLPGPSRFPSTEGAVDQLLRLARERPAELDLLVVGSLTNVAAAMARDPDVLSRYRSVWILGGYSRRPTDPVVHSEDFNTYCSPDAAARVYASRVPLNVVPISTTFQVIFSDDHLAALHASDSVAARFVHRILPQYLDFYADRMGRRTIPVHDPTAAAALLHPELVLACEHRPIVVEPWLGSFRAVALSQDDPGPADDRADMRLITLVDGERLLNRLVDAITG